MSENHNRRSERAPTGDDERRHGESVPFYNRRENDKNELSILLSEIVHDYNYSKFKEIYDKDYSELKSQVIDATDKVDSSYSRLQVMDVKLENTTSKNVCGVGGFNITIQGIIGFITLAASVISIWVSISSDLSKLTVIASDNKSDITAIQDKLFKNNSGTSSIFTHKINSTIKNINKAVNENTSSIKAIKITIEDIELDDSTTVSQVRNIYIKSNVNESRLNKLEKIIIKN